MTTARAAHVQPYLDSLAYRIDTAAGSVVITGDTARCPEVVALAHDADVLLCCCWDHQDGAEQIDECVGDGMSGTMCGPYDAASLAAEAGVARLVLVHATPSIAEPQASARAVQVAAEIFDGPVTFAHEAAPSHSERIGHPRYLVPRPGRARRQLGRRVPPTAKAAMLSMDITRT